MAPYIETRTPSPSSVKETDAVRSPFPVPTDLSSVQGTVYCTKQLLTEQASYAISSGIFSYSPETFGLDSAIGVWEQAGQKNGEGVVPRVTRLEARAGAASVLLGYLESRAGGAGLQTVLATPAALELMKPVLAQYAVSAPKASPIVFQVAAVDYADKLVADYTAAAEVAKDLGLGLVSSTSLADSQAVSVYAALLGSAVGVPSIHVYDGLRGTRQSNRATGVLPAQTVAAKYRQIGIRMAKLAESGSASQRAARLLSEVNAEFGTDLKPFEYTGPASPERVIVAFGSVEADVAAQIAATPGSKTGAINARILSPFLDSDFAAALPQSAKEVVVLGQVRSAADVTDARVHSALYRDVVTSLVLRAGGLGGRQVTELKYARGDSVEDVLAAEFGPVAPLDTAANVGKLVFWDDDNSKTVDSPGALAHTLALDDKNNVAFYKVFDNEVLSGAVQSSLTVAPAAMTLPLVDAAPASLVFVNDAKLTTAYDVLAAARDGAAVIIGGQKADAAELEKALGPQFKAAAAAKNIALYALDYAAIGDNSETHGRTEAMVQQAAVWKVIEPSFTVDQITTKIVLANGVDTELVAASVVRLIETAFDKAFKPVEIPKEWAAPIEPATAEAKTEAKTEPKNEAEAETVELPQLPTSARPTAFVANDLSHLEGAEESSAANQTVADATRKLVFREAYGVSQELRPDLPTKTFVSKVKVNQRVTPADYDRHIFHLELDITGTGLKYAIGEALGVHAPNNEEGVRDFIEWYGLDADAPVSLPSRDDHSVEEIKTVYHALRDNLDLFGKPPKKFYEGLAPFATDDKQRAALERLASADGAEELKKRQEVDFCNYVDILQEFDSAHPSVAELAHLIAPLKRREYSIASSQKVHPNAVHLLIVVVDWTTKDGKKRFGQCSKFLSGLSTGAEVVVSVKPSVMKLPKDPRAPVIMAGLGTGLAPFKAFLEEKYWQKVNGHEIGDIYLFLGARHQRQEYLYGELFEAYKDAGILTYIGAAFSRDQPHKIYIQDRIREAKEPLIDAFVKKNGNFYLCGPTWPVPDISAALSDIVVTEASSRGESVDPVRIVEDLKEAERYILEVY